ncbi:efflux RND transporter periplasmic adaptor subunit [Rhodoblastus sp.]|jgi:Cu(I)/Ag(I) efflux system membrane fusion protein|uniref:efflux RND transporter periplasmic adaptor subunit n=1 Tax=Rhodoblastus sp. TaxID=1962975 RepID=UPI0025D761E9|nr:efflux RND transporter periplasmic adaptor subunit [Rhodoblastus sp.]
MSRAGRAGLALAAILAAGTGGYWAGRRDVAPPPVSFPPTSWLRAIPWFDSAAAIPASADPAPSGPVIYYRDPDGRPAYSATPRKTADGRAFAPVHASEDVGFEGKPTAAVSAPVGGAPKKILYYRNPMGLPDTSPSPKKDSMGMDYLPVYAGEDEDGVTVKLAPGKLQRTGVRSEIVSDQVIVRQVRVPGTVQPDERRVSVVSVPTDAFVGKVESVTTGDRVRKGQPLLQIRSPEIAAAAAQLMINPGYEGTNRRLENLNVPQEVIAEITRTRQVPLAFIWPSPRDGVVLMRNATEGMKMSAGDALFRIADLSTVWVLADVPEYDLANVRPGQTATIRVRSLPGRTFQGRVALIYPQVAKETRTTKVRIEIPNPDGVLRPDMYADVEIASGSGGPVLAVPDSAVIDTGARQVVILDKGEGRFEPREVKIGTQGGGFTEIRGGIAVGDRVVVAANFLIDAESNLKAALRGMTSPETKP